MGESKKKLEEKKKAFAENPGAFIDRRELLLSAVKQEGPNGEAGISFTLNHGASDMALKAILFDLHELVSDYILKKKVMREANEAMAKRIITDMDGR